MARSRKLNLKSILKVVVFAALAILLIGGISSCFGDDTDKVSMFEFERGELDKNGEHVESKRAVYSEAFKCQGLKCVPDFDGHITYDVYFYDADKNFISSVRDLKKTYEGDVPFATYARVVIYPEVPEDESEDDYKIPFYKVYSVANKLSITVSEKQKEMKTLYYEERCKNGYELLTDLEPHQVIYNSSETSKVSHGIDLNSKYNSYSIFVRIKQGSSVTTENGFSLQFVEYGYSYESDIVLSSFGLEFDGTSTNSWFEIPLNSTVVEEAESLGADGFIFSLPIGAECYVVGK